jgi:hypothetical protein
MKKNITIIILIILCVLLYIKNIHSLTDSQVCGSRLTRKVYQLNDVIHAITACQRGEKCVIPELTGGDQ